MTGLDAGRVLRPGSAEYDAARRVWNAMVDRRPRLIVRCTGVDDIVAGLEHARTEGLEVGVRCGGHSIVGHAVPEDGLMLDLTPMSRSGSIPSVAGRGSRAGRCWALSTSPRSSTGSPRQPATSRTRASGA